MTDPKRLSLEPESALEAELLRAGRRAPPSGAKHRALVVASSVGIAEGLTAVGAAAKGSSAASALGKAGFLIALKWVGVATVTGATAVVGAVALQARTHASTPDRAKVTAPAASTQDAITRARGSSPSAVPAEPVAPSTLRPTPPVGSPPVAANVAPSASVARPSRTVIARATAALADDTRPSTRSASPAEKGSTLPTELALLGRAQAALNAGEPERALALLDGYGERFPGGDLREEAAVLRIEALARAGDHAQASRLAEAFLARAPESPYAGRIRSVLAARPNP